MKNLYLLLTACFVFTLSLNTSPVKAQTVDFKGDTVSGTNGQVVYVPIRVRNFNNIIAFQGTIGWNPAIARLDTVNPTSLTLPGAPSSYLFNYNNRNSGYITYLWTDPNNGATNGVNWAFNDSIFKLKFTILGTSGQSTPVRIYNGLTPLEVSDANCFCPIGLDTFPGRINVLGSGNTITTGAITGSPFCAGASVSIPFTITGTFTGGNVFTAQLSDGTGSFAAPVVLGTLTSTTAGTISGTIPTNTPTGTGYRIRVIASAPATTGSDNGVNLTINAIPATPTISAGGPTTFCSGGSVNLSSSSASGNIWSPSGSSQIVNVTASGTYTCRVVVSGCTSAVSNSIVVTVNSVPATPSITAGGPTTFCSGGSVNLTSSSASGNIWAPSGSGQTTNVTSSGSYTVQVVVSGCTSAVSSPVTVTVNSLPSAPTLTAGGPTTFCSGGSVNLTSSSASGNIWSPSGSGQTVNVTASGTYTAQVVVSGCTSAVSNSITVTATPLPATPTLTAGGPTSFCTGGSVNLTSSSASGNIWSPSGSGQTTNVTSSGTYTVQVVASGCTSAVSNAITVTATPVPATPTLTAGGPTTFCSGGSVTLTSSSASGNVWSPSGSGQSFSATTSGSYTVQVVASGCTSAVSNTVTVTVNAAPATPTLTAGGPTSFCTGGSVNLTSSSASGNIWSPSGSGQTTNVTSSGTYTVQVVASGCTSAVSNAITVTATPVPATPTLTAGGPTTFCSGGSVTLTSSSASGNVWSPSGSGQSFSATTSGSYTVQVVASGCTSSVSNTITVTVNAAPATPTLTAGGPTSFCTGGSVNLTSSSASGNIWSPSGSGQTTNVTSSGTYTVQVVASGCTSAVSNAITVTVNPVPATPTLTAGGPTTFCNGGSVTLTSSSASGNIWSPSGSGQSFNATASGSYTVQVVASGCTSAVSNTITVTVTPGPTTPTLTAGGPTTFCSGGSVTLTSSSASGNIWSPSGTGQSFNATTSGTYTVQVVVSGCTSAVSNAITVTADPLPPTPTITAGGPTSFCTGGSVNLTSSSASGNIWSPSGSGQTINVTTSGTYTVQAVAAGCTSAVSTPVVVTVSPLPAAPTLTAGGPTTFCAGGAVTLTSSSASGNVWSPTGSGQSFNANTSGSYTVQVVASGCTSAVSNVITVTVDPLPATPTITAGGPTSFCTGGSVNLTSSSASGNIWSPSGSGSTINVTTSGTYTVQAVVGACTSAVSTPVTVTVNTPPAAPVITVGGPTAICQGGSVTLTSSATSGNTWSPGGQVSQSITVAVAGTYTVTETNGGCTSPASAPITVTVNALPTANYNSTPNFLNFTFTDLSTGSPTTWSWDFGDATNSTLQNPTHTYANPGSYNVCLIATNTCGSDTFCTSVTATAQCLTPVAGYNFNIASLTATFTDQSTNTPTSWLWNFGDGNTSTLQNPVHNYATQGSYVVCLTATNNCGATQACSTVVVSCPVPVSAFNFAVSTFTVNFTDQSTGASSWSWNFGDGNTSSLQNPTHTYTASGTYTVCLTVSNNCTTIVSCRPVTVTCNAPLSTFSSQLTGGTSVLFTDQSVNGPTSWSWDFGDGTFSSLQNPSHTFPGSGPYTVCLEVTNSCGSNKSCQSVTPVGILSALSDEFLHIFPNPTRSEITIETYLQEGTDMEITLLNSLGEVAGTWNLGRVSGNFTHRIDLGALAAGVYSAGIRAGNEVVWKKVVKE